MLCSPNILGKISEIFMKSYSPGQNLKSRKFERTSDYSMQLVEKQKLRYFYGLTER